MPKSSPRCPWRVLIFPGGTEIALELRQALAWCKEVQLFSAGAGVSNHAPYVFARHSIVPSVHEAGWLDALQEVVSAYRITHIFPAHDDALLALMENTDRLSAKVVTSPLKTCRITRSKSATMSHLRATVPTPKCFAQAKDVTEFPVFLKPDRGQASLDTVVARNTEELHGLLLQDPYRIVLEYLPGPEYTIDCFSDRELGLLYAGARERKRIKSGIATDSVSVDDPQLADYASRINAALELYGAWFFQVKADREGVLKIMEVAPRIAGTSAVSRARGVNLPLLSLYEAERIPVTTLPAHSSVEVDRALVNRYRHSLSYRTLYVDLDDTLVIHGKVNVELMKLLYQAINSGVRLVLLTRHSGELQGRLARHKLGGLFDEVIQLRDGESKADFIQGKEAILIDDSFAERRAVHQQLGIPVIDPSMVEMLFDERM